MTWRRLCGLLRKEWLDLLRNRMIFLPVALVTLVSLVLPFLVAVILPAMVGHCLSDDADLVKMSLVAGVDPGLPPDARIQTFLFLQFMLVLLLVPITGAMALAAHAVVGEKQTHTLEPLLATPITVTELLMAKVLGALLPTLAISLVSFALYVTCIAMFAEPGVLRSMVSVRSAVVVGIVGPAAALVSLQAAVVISSRVNDPRTAQQFGVLIILPLTGLLIAQFTGTVWVTADTLALVGLGLLAVWALLTLVSVALFDREAILTRWK